MVHVVTLSQKGDKSAVNEDACLALASKGVFVVADGVGGGPSGDFASRTLVQEIEALCATSDQPEEDLLQAIQSANLKIYQAGQDPKLNGMATTVAAIVIQGESLLVCHVGDSRVYLLRNGDMSALTRDHSKLIAKNDVQKQVVTNALGIRESVKIEISRFSHLIGDQLLLMTDGISDVVNERRMHQLLSVEGRSTSEKLKSLVEESEMAGGKDDKTVLCVF
ncbi:PP2C family protein-serine/threonine phosphatase [Ketobacter sp.]|uniref:PP2C family protein-serine/threonine phosphatase n=1 Tax=Ketobacter sp. TaxID=2083498 RepID=UPI000F231CCC|nr:protein phosphatase 2C domain-containing protein [Ketobacter sp.]RLT97957.1 MAG: serine/threonine-protein phosphatase [Ketobacter sp.]